MTPDPQRPAQAPAEALKETLEWYAIQAAGCRKVTSEGNEARRLLDCDGGERARVALRLLAQQPEQPAQAGATCGTCEHWEAPRDEYEDKGTCTQIVGRFEGGRQDMAYGGGFEGYGDYFRCAPDFGCLLHQPRALADAEQQRGEG